MPKTEIVKEVKNKEVSPVHVAEVVRHGAQFLIPEGIKIDEAIELLQRRKKYEEESCVLIEEVDAFVWDGALAFQKAMQEMFGWATAEPIPGLFGEKLPQMMSVDVDIDKTVLVPWGEFSLPNIEGRVGTETKEKNGRIIFVAYAKILRKDEPRFRVLVEMTRKYAKEDSIYLGKAVKIRFRDEDGDLRTIPEIKFIDVRHVQESQLIYSKEVMTAISTSLFTPVERSEECRKYGIPLKRGVLLSGPYGTGKTLACYVTAKKCLENGWTFLYCDHADELADMVKFAQSYQPAVVFCEDVDRVVSGERSIGMDDILNIIDGIESKSTEIMVVLTTNHVEKINQALLRPGRLDAVINVLPPDAEAVERLLRMYGKGLIPKNVDLTEVAQYLAGKIPAVIRECIERSKLAALKLSTNGNLLLTGEAILDAATGMRNQLELLEPKNKEAIKDQVHKAIGQKLTQGVDFEVTANGVH